MTWLDIKGYFGLYQMSDTGEVRRVLRYFLLDKNLGDYPNLLEICLLSSPAYKKRQHHTAHEL